jgi:hypothetical protein
MRSKILILLFLPIILDSCDMLTTKEKDLIGNLELINPNVQGDTTYHLIFSNNGINENILDETVLQISGNDSLLFAKCRNINFDLNFYKITHNKGYSPIKTTDISQTEFVNGINSIKSKYQFLDESE